MGYGYSSTYDTSGGGLGGAFGFLFWVFLICYFVSWVLAMGIVTKAAKEKGYDDLGGKLWFIGLFGFVFTPPIIVSALPDRKLQAAQVSDASAGQAAEASDELPDL